MKQGWEIKKIGEVVQKIFAGGDKPHMFSEQQTDICCVPVYGNGVTNDGLCGYTDHYVVNERCLTVSARGTVGYCCVRNEPFVPIVRLITIIPQESIGVEFLCYVLSTINIENNGVAIPQLTVPMINNVSIPLPPIAEQEKIVAELDCLSGIIEKKKQQLKELDNLAQSIFYEMFGDPVENDKGWDIVTLDDVFEIGSSKRVFESQWTDSGVPFYRAREIVKLSKGENIDSPIFISEELYHEYSRKYGVPAEGDMMVTAVGTLGVCYLVKNTDRFYFKDGNTLWFKSRGLCETRFIKDEFATDFIVNQIKGNANAAVVGTFTITNAKKTRVILPPLSLQQEYVRKVQHIDKQKELLAQSIKETETLFNSRMDYYFN